MSELFSQKTTKEFLKTKKSCGRKIDHRDPSPTVDRKIAKPGIGAHAPSSEEDSDEIFRRSV